MNIFQSAKDLVDKVLNVVDSKRLTGVNNSMQICFHEILYNIYILELFCCWRWWDEIYYANDIFMNELFHEFDLPEYTLCVDSIIEGSANLFDCHLLSIAAVVR